MYSQNYLDVKQVPFLFEVEPDAKVSVLTHASFLNWTTLNREKTAKRKLNNKLIIWHGLFLLSFVGNVIFQKQNKK